MVRGSLLACTHVSWNYILIVSLVIEKLNWARYLLLVTELRWLQFFQEEEPFGPMQEKENEAPQFTHHLHALNFHGYV